MENNVILRLLDDLKDLQIKLDDSKLEIVRLSKPSLYQSEQIDQLAMAFAKAKTELRSIIPSGSTVAFGKTRYYAKLVDIIDQTMPVLGSHGLTLNWREETRTDGGKDLVTLLIHDSGQWLASRTRLLAEDTTQQKIGSAITYQRRYQAMMMLGVAPADDPDDDDGQREADVKLATDIQKGKVDTKKLGHIPLSDREHAEIQNLLEPYPNLAESVLKTYNVATLSDLSGGDYPTIMNRLRKSVSGYEQIATKR